MKKTRMATHIVLLTLFMGACAPGTPFPQPDPTPVRLWAVELVQSGGFAGVNMTVRIDTGGLLAAADARAARQVTRQLSEAELRELDLLLEGANFGGPAQTHSTCADCFVYDLQLSGGATPIRWQGDDTTLTSSGLGKLVAFLIELRDRALAGAS